MASLNKVTLIGRLGKDPEIRATQSGQNVVSLSLATEEKWRDTHGEQQQRTEWHRIVCFNEVFCDLLEKYVRKGSQIYIEGMLQTRKWTDQSGIEKYVTEIVLGKFNAKLIMLDSKRDDHGNEPARAAAAQSRAPARDKSYAGRDADLDDEIPF